MNLLQGFGYIKILWALFHALAAFYTFIRLSFRRQLAIKKPGSPVIPVDVSLIVKIKCPGDVHLIGTGHAILATGAGNRADFNVFFPHLID